MRRTKAIDALARFVQCSPQYICMLHLAILAVFLCVHPTHATDEPISLIRQVDESTRLQHDFETEYEVLTFRRRPLADFDVFDELQEEPIMREQIRVVAHGRKLRQDLERTADQRRPYVISHIWDGTRLWILYPDERIVEVHSSPPRSVDLHVQGHYFNRIESRYRGEWATTIALSANEYTCETNGDAIRCRTNEVFAEGLFSGLSVKFVIQDRFAETPKMSSFTQHFTSKQSRPDLLHGQYGFEIVWQTTRWDNIDDVAMPASAEFRVT